MTRHDWRKIIAAFATLSVLWVIGGFVAADQYQTLNTHTNRINRNVKFIVVQGRQLAGVAVSVTAAECEMAYDDDQQDRLLVVEFLARHQVAPIRPECKRAVALTQRLLKEGLSP